MHDKAPSQPTMTIKTQADGTLIELRGSWDLRSISLHSSLPAKLRPFRNQDDSDPVWNLESVEALDSAGAWLLWQAWGEEMPLSVRMKPEHRRLFERWQNYHDVLPDQSSLQLAQIVARYQDNIRAFYRHVFNGVSLLGQLLIDLLYLCKTPAKIPWAEISTTIYGSGVKALGITALVGFLIGIVLSYLSALQLQTFGAEIYIINILGLSILRELGPLLAAILVAGRSGSALTAQIGIMRVAEELDALSAMGISHSLRIVLPIVIALTVTLPLLTVWTNAAALLGGIVSAWHTLDISYQQFIQRLPDTVPLVNVFIGVGKAAVFGLLIGIIACHYGFHIKPNAESLGTETTNSVVTSITVVIMVDALFAILFMEIGMP